MGYNVAMTREDLIAQVAAGHQPEYLFFWGHRPRPDGRIGKSCLSQWWEAPFTVEGATYATAEHWMMAAKARVCGDEAIIPRILAAKTPNDAKALGRKVQGYDDAKWAAARYDAVVEGNRHKFGQHPELGGWLRGTGDQVLVEASPVDAIWGIGLAEDHPDAPRPDRWPGLNLLGFALMDVRAELARG